MANVLPIALIINCVTLSAAILIQNESPKDAIGSQKSSTGPIEILTWVFFIIYLFLLLINVKTNDF